MLLHELLKKEPKIIIVIKAIWINPYIERQELANLFEMKLDELDNILEPAISSMFVLELTSQADSNMESRVPKKAYLINPEIEDEIKAL